MIDTVLQENKDRGTDPQKRIVLIYNFIIYTVKKVSHFPVPSRDVTDQTLPGREKLIYSRPGRV
jgi:hypothetical protein